MKYRRQIIAITIIAVIALMTFWWKAKQSDLWWPYLADYDGQPGSILVNLTLKKCAPVTEYPNLIVTGVSYPSKNVTGLPDSKESDLLHALSDKRLTLVERLTPSILAGTFTHNGESLDYIYVKNKAGVEDALKKFYQDNCPDRKPYINLKDDPKWEAYLEFLFPNEKAIEFYRLDLITIGYFKK